MNDSSKRKIISQSEISKKIAAMNEELQGFWANDRWDIRECPEPSAIELCKNPSLRNRWVRFDRVENLWLRTELKYFYYYHLTNKVWNAKTVWIRKGTVINRMLDFFDLKYPDISSITEVPIERAMTEYRSFLITKGVRITTTNYKITANQEKIAIQANSYYVTNLKQFMEFYEDYYFDGEEWEKDVWDRRKLPLPADKVNPTQYEYLISFKEFRNPYFKRLAKRYAKLILNTLSYSYVIDTVRKIREFFHYLDINYKQIQRIHQISRIEIEGYLSEINTMGLSPVTINGKINTLEVFFNTLTRLEWDDVPSRVLIFKEDYLKEPKAKPRFIDEYVLEQLNSHLDKLPEYIATMTMIVQECGMRVSELCTLKKGCLLEDKDRDYFLKYYQWKMKKEHIIPVSKEVAVLIKIREDKVSKEFPDSEYLFPRSNGSPLKQDTFRRELNQLAFDNNIVDKEGNIFRFQAHAFRHTVGTKMINNGVPQHIVQKFLGHESPEMTSRYAHIFDETLKNEFAKFREKMVTNNGNVIDLDNDNEADDVTLQWFKKNINAQVLPNGYCRLPVIAGSCPHANACLDCTHFCTSKQFLPQHQEHLKLTEDLLATAKDKQWQRQIETNSRVKERLEQIIGSLKE
ncbi:tyrosine-type recombinase/integrase [Bacillus sp. MHSD_36]|uniref:tyrosine-type recombinase/integrase n=1 Tax=unclassified Bacillus (in: firmicutes) TaxID=185979 RepID=UPI0027422A84|nr:MULTISPECIES: tyrosine-type recombinase/integrase [unclassified Bacillus (in: firmicutes)]MDP7990394.1 tyrosine-type recombinase/integrase [Bacillus sp. MHSD_36]MDR4978831.1 tyrosine-type recombinase/integrase [Bacillus sp. MHSD_37]